MKLPRSVEIAFDVKVAVACRVECFALEFAVCVNEAFVGRFE